MRLCCAYCFAWRKQPIACAGERLPNLRELKLSGSRIESIRNLGTSLPNVQVLWVSRCGLRDLAGLAAFPALKELYAAFNELTDLSPLPGAESLELLDLDTNALSEFGQLELLGCCRSLTNVTLEGNSVADLPLYRDTMRRLLPGLQYLDDAPLEKRDCDSGAMGPPKATSSKAFDAAMHGQLSAEAAEAASMLEEMSLVRQGIRHARLGIDDSMYDSEQAVAFTAFDAADPYRPRTALLSSSGGGWGPAGARPSTAASGVAALLGGRNSRSSRSRGGSSGSMNSTSGSFGKVDGGGPGRPHSGASSNGSSFGSRPTTATMRQSVASRERELGFSEASILDGEQLSDHGGSELTSGEGVVVGNLTKALRQRQKAQAGGTDAHRVTEEDEDGEFVGRVAPRAELNMLEELKAWKLETAQMQLSHHVSEAERWNSASTIEHRANSDGTQANVWRADEDGDNARTTDNRSGTDSHASGGSENAVSAVARPCRQTLENATNDGSDWSCGLTEGLERKLIALDARRQVQVQPLRGGEGGSASAAVSPSSSPSDGTTAGSSELTGEASAGQARKAREGRFASRFRNTVAASQ